MKIIEFRAEAFKRLQAVEIRPDGHVVKITGQNEQGKSSVLDAIWAALGGKAMSPREPIRKGKSEASVELKIGKDKADHIVTRKWKRQDDGTVTSSLWLFSVGRRNPSPQAALDEILGPLTLDPLEFDRMTDLQRADALKALVPGIDFDELERQNAADYSERTIAGRRAKQERAAAEAITLPPGPVPEWTDVSELAEELRNATLHNQTTLNRVQRRKKAEEDIAAWRARAADLRQQADELEQHAEKTSKQLSEADPLPDLIDVESIQAKIKNVGPANRTAELAKKRDEHRKQAENFEAQVEALTKAIEARRQQKRDAVAAANLGVPGLELTDDDGTPVVMLAGVPFSQASDAERLRASVAVAMAGNPTLRIIRCKDGSLLDKRSMAILEEMAKAADFQVWVEVVADEAGAGIYIEDGMVQAVDGKRASL